MNSREVLMLVLAVLATATTSWLFAVLLTAVIGIGLYNIYDELWPKKPNHPSTVRARLAKKK